MIQGRRLVGVAVAACVLAVALIGASVLGTRAEGKSPDRQAVTAGRGLLAGIPQRGSTLGRPDAAVTLVEFADLQCPYCAQWSAVAFDDIVEEYVRPGKVRLEFRGLAFLGPDSERGLRFAVAAGRQGRLWDVVHGLYANQGAENGGWLNDDLLRDAGGEIPALDVEQAFADASSPGVAQEIAAASEHAEQLGIQGTPSFAVGRTGGRLSPIAIASLDAEALRPTLDDLLAGE